MRNVVGVAATIVLCALAVTAIALLPRDNLADAIRFVRSAVVLIISSLVSILISLPPALAGAAHVPTLFFGFWSVALGFFVRRLLYVLMLRRAHRTAEYWSGTHTWVLDSGQRLRSATEREVRDRYYGGNVGWAAHQSFWTLAWIVMVMFFFFSPLVFAALERLTATDFAIAIPLFVGMLWAHYDLVWLHRGIGKNECELFSLRDVRRIGWPSILQPHTVDGWLTGLEARAAPFKWRTFHAVFLVANVSGLIAGVIVAAALFKSPIASIADHAGLRALPHFSRAMVWIFWASNVGLPLLLSITIWEIRLHDYLEEQCYEGEYLAKIGFAIMWCPAFLVCLPLTAILIALSLMKRGSNRTIGVGK